MTVANPTYADLRWNADENRWEQARRVIGDRRVTLGPQASQQYLEAPEHLAMVLARYRAAAALVGGAATVLEVGCGEGIGAAILARGRNRYLGIDADGAALAAVAETRPGVEVRLADALTFRQDGVVEHPFDAVVALDVIEHIPNEREAAFMDALAGVLIRPHGVCVIGTPSANAEHLASPQSRAGHVNLYTPERLGALLRRHFRVVQEFGMQDTSLHVGHPGMRHYLLVCGVGPKEC